MSNTLTRKERERTEREAKILQLAQRMLAEVGYLGLSMDRIAAEMEYSKGTIYQHFRNKEEVILALANIATETRIAMFERASRWPGNSRTRMAAIGVAAECFVEQFPMHFAVEQVVRSSSIWEKTSEERRQFLDECEARCLQIVSGVVHDAISHSDLTLPEGHTAEDLVFGLWSLNFGAYTIMVSSDTLQDNGVSDPVSALRLNQNRMLDGYNWQPLSNEVDYPEIMKQVKKEILKDE